MLADHSVKNGPSMLPTTLAQRFGAMVRGRQQDQLDPWLEACLSSGIPDLRTFAEGPQREYSAIKAALTYPYSFKQAVNYTC